MTRVSELILGPLPGDPVSTERILRSLPEWFGIEPALRHYVEVVSSLPVFTVQRNDEVIGFLALKYHSAHAAEIYVMGIDPRFHRCGLGRVLVQRVEMHLRSRGCEYLQVKTLSPGHPDRNYARTREFYTAMGFRVLEVFPELWGAENPCQVMIKHLQPASAPD